MEKTEPIHKEEHATASPQETVQVELQQERPMSMKHVQLKTNLEQAVVSEAIDKLEPAIKEVKKECVPNCTELLKKVSCSNCYQIHMQAFLCMRIKVNEHTKCNLSVKLCTACLSNSYMMH